MIILGATLVLLGVLVGSQALWFLGATLVAVGAVLGLVGSVSRPMGPFSGWTQLR